MIKNFENFLNENDSLEISAFDDLTKKKKLDISVEIDDEHEDYATISVYFTTPFLYIDLKNIRPGDSQKLSPGTIDKIDKIAEELENALNKEYYKLLELSQEKLKEASSEINAIPEVTALKYGI